VLANDPRQNFLKKIPRRSLIGFRRNEMTIKEIAELCGVTEQTILNWTHKISDDPVQNAHGSVVNDLPKNAQGLTEKLAEARKSGKDPADFTLDETLTIIGDGGGNKTLASLLAENAANKDALAVYKAGSPGGSAEELCKAYLESIRDTILGEAQRQLMDAAAGRVPDLMQKSVETQRYLLTKGGRVYICYHRRNGIYGMILVYDADGICVRQGFGMNERKVEGRIVWDAAKELLEELRRKGKDLGEMEECRRVQTVDIFIWRFELGLKKAFQSAPIALAQQPGKILDFRPAKAPGVSCKDSRGIL
jgi:hypothetical protein